MMRTWEWPVDGETRLPKILPRDKEQVRQAVAEASFIVGQNIKTEAKAFKAAGIVESWPWEKTFDTLIAGHLLASNLPHDLTAMVLQYLGEDIEPFEKRLKAACTKARNIAKRRFPTWRIATKGDPDLPSAKGKLSSFDYWLPRAIAKAMKYEESHPWYTVCAEYANQDSGWTMSLWLDMEQEIKSRGHWEIFLESMRLPGIITDMEQRGVSINRANLDKLSTRYSKESAEAGRVCYAVAARLGYDLELPKGAAPNNSLRHFCFGYDLLVCPSCKKEYRKRLGSGQINPLCPKCEDRPRCEIDSMPFLALPVVALTKKALAPSMDANVLQQWETILEEGTDGYQFIKALQGKRKRDTAISYMDSYKRFWLPWNGQETPDWYRLHPSVNQTGTDTLRCSSSNPNEQNISKKEGFNLRFCFGPAPGREWWSLDAKNLELRIPAWEADERMMIDLFQRTNDPPYFGSYHLLIFDILHPDLFAKHGAKCKDVYESTWYQWTKNGNFATTYGAVEESGTADRAYHVPGAQRVIKERLRGITALNEKYVRLANKYGYVETLPDKRINPRRGYPLLCTRTERGGIKPTVPFNYHVQGSACWWKRRCMVECEKELIDMNIGAFITMEIHDELVFDFPRAVGTDSDGNVRYGNLRRVRRLADIMEQCGRDINVETPVTIEYHAHNWAEGVVV